MLAHEFVAVYGENYLRVISPQVVGICPNCGGGIETFRKNCQEQIHLCHTCMAQWIHSGEEALQCKLRNERYLTLCQLYSRAQTGEVKISSIEWHSDPPARQIAVRVIH